MNDLNTVDILLIEDNPQDTELTVRALKKVLVNNLFIVEAGAEALDFIFCRNDYSGKDFSSHPKVIFLDLKLPKVDGFEVLKTLKNNEQIRTIPVVVFTSSKENSDIMKAYHYGANSYIVKPVDSDQFTEVISNLGTYWLLLNESVK